MYKSWVQHVKLIYAGQYIRKQVRCNKLFFYTPRQPQNLEIAFEDSAPYYSLSFQKIEGGTGVGLTFEGNTESGDQKRIEPDNIEIEPEESLYQVGYGFIG